MKTQSIKTVLIYVSLSFFAILLFLLFSSGENVNHNQSKILIAGTKINKQEISYTINKINNRNEKIRTISCFLRTTSQMSYKRPVKLNGSINYEKEKKFRLILNSFIGKELDIGSNNNVFWFWSNRMQKPGLYWSTYENFTKTRLKTPFNPLWLSHCLGINTITYTNNTTIDLLKDKLRVINAIKNGNNEDVVTITYIDYKKSIITGHGIYDSKGILEASSEIQKFNDEGLPEVISFMWYKEQASMIWHLSEIKTNVSINDKTWNLPRIMPMIDMSRE